VVVKELGGKMRGGKQKRSSFGNIDLELEFRCTKFVTQHFT
jgi:hypothetical protein